MKMTTTMELMHPMASTEMESCVSEPLTANHDSSERCANPFCRVSIDSKHGKKFCCDRCRMDGYVLRRARAMLDEIGAVRFKAILQGTCF